MEASVMELSAYLLETLREDGEFILQAIRAARANGFVHNEALANELAARFYAARGFEKIAQAYLQDARYCYRRWRAAGKVRQLDQLYPYLYRGQHHSRIGEVLPPVLVVAPVSERPALRSLRRMEHEYGLRAELDPGWAVRPFALAPHQGRTMLVLTDPGGDPLDRLLGRPMESAPFLRCAIGLSSALGHLHGRGLIHPGSLC
jgi:GAF domain-containing protein